MGRRPGAPVVERDAEHGDVYQFRFTAHGVRHRGSTGRRDFGEAQAEALRIYAAALAHKPLPKTRAVKRPAASADLTDTFARFIASLTGKKSAEYLRKMESHFGAHFAHRWRTLAEMTQPGAIDTYASDRLAGKSPAVEPTKKFKRRAKAEPVTVHKELVTLRRFLKWTLKMGMIAELPHVEPVSQVSSYTPPDYSTEDAKRLLAALPSRREHPSRHPVREFFTLQWAQASRPGEVESLRVRDVNLKRREMTIRQSEDKARVGRTVALSDEAAEVIEDMLAEKRPADSFLFGVHNYRAQLAKAAAALELPRPTRHHLRHFRLTELGHTPGVSPAALQFLAGHKHMSTTDKYIHSKTKATRDLFDAVSKVSRSVTKKDRSRRADFPDSATVETRARRRR
jgi:integrase